MQTVNIFDTKDVEYIRKSVVYFLEELSADGVVEIIRNDEHFVDAKIKPRKRIYFYLHYGAFRFKGKTFEMSLFKNSINIQINGGDLDITDLDLKGFFDNVSIDVDY